MVGFVDVPAVAAQMLVARLGPMAQPDSSGEPPVVVRFTPPPRPRSSVLLATAGARVAADDDERFFLLDRAGRRGQLPVTSGERVLLVDPAIDARPMGTLNQLAERLLEWQVAAHGMVMLKGSAVVVPEGGVALLGFAGSGKSSVLLAMLPDASAYLADERLVLSGPRTVAAWPAPVWLGLDRHYRLPVGVFRAMSRRTRVALSLAGAATTVPGSRAVIGRVLADRWVAIDPVAAFPALDRRPESQLDAVVFLLPSGPGALRMEPLLPDDMVTRVAHQVAYLDHVGLFGLRAMFGTALPRHVPWVLAPPLEQRLARLPAFLAGVTGWAAHVPFGTPAADVAGAIRTALA
ncbi:MAG TPA: hypothetical protein VM142_02815 [Acidimicrobiales bacterium]|nr:hypothetical protein [Acidimicrobiales bacterium]